MGSTNTWGDLIEVRPRYRRSVHLERDAFESSALDGYLLTPLVRTLIARIGEGLQAPNPTRAWSVTGPYGTGKSAFALFLAHLMCPPDVEASRQARAMLEAADKPLHGLLCGAKGVLGPFRGLWPVVATGERRSLDAILLDALSRSLNQFYSGRGKRPGIIAEVDRAAKRAGTGKSLPVREVVGFFESAAAAVCKSSRGGEGLIVILDEAGKALEFAAQAAGTADVQLLQELAEASNRSGNCPIVFVALLHQAFEQYAGRLSLTERGEWAKVQGRFEDLPFQEGSREVLRLVGDALGRRKAFGRVSDQVGRVATDVARLARIPGSAHELAQLLAAAAPLHPATALLVGPVFRSRIAQNERSLFAYLSSAEPHAFQAFLGLPAIERKQVSLLSPAGLYDYIAGSLGGRLHGYLGREWVQIEAALRRLPVGSSGLDADVIKTIGLLGLFGEAAGLQASDEVLRTIFASIDLVPVIDRLRKSSLIIFRKFRGAYQLYEGSDLDVDSLVRDALAHIDVQTTLVRRLERVVPPRPIVARRHLFETGTFRYFELRYLDSGAFDEGIPAADAQADGALFLVLDSDARARRQLLTQLSQPLKWLPHQGAAKPILVALPEHIGRLLEIAGELAALEWVRTHTPELQEDDVARREVSGRLAEAERQLGEELERIFTGEVPCRWIHQAEQLDIRGPHDLARVLSELCNAAYSQAPIILNELINRRQLSSAAAAARRGLMEAIVQNADKVRLGFEGTPPEVSMYRSILERHGIHKKRGGTLTLGAPTDKVTGSLRPAWDALERLLQEAQEQRLRVPQLYEKLRLPPLGLKDGVLPILLVAILMAHKDEMAIYEDGAFVPQLSGAVVERLLRQPDRFEAQRLSISGPRAAVFGKLAQTMVTSDAGTSIGVVPMVRALVRVVRDLTDFARTTKTITPTAQAVRETLLRAREPAPLVYRDLPVALGFDSFAPKGPPTSAHADKFVEALKGAIREIQQAYPALLDLIEDALRTGLSLPARPEALREELGARAQRLLPLAVEAPLKAFLIRASDEDLPREEWLVSIGTLLGNKPPESWHDRDIDQARLSLGLLCRRMGTLESLALAQDGFNGKGVPMLRVAVTEQGQPEQERVVPLRPGDRKLVNSIYQQLRDMAEGATASLPRDAVVAALGLVARDMMRELTTHKESTREVGA